MRRNVQTAAKYIVLAAVAALAPSARCAKFDLIYANPGEDSSREIRVTWHSDSPSCILAYKPEQAGGRAKRAEVKKVCAPVAYTGCDEYWRYTASIKGLVPGTKYVYKVADGKDVSPAQHFKTAGQSGKYNFLWMGDVHSTPAKPGKMKSVEELVSLAERASASSGGIDFVLFSGDAVKHGQTYACWQQWNGCSACAKYMMAAVCGNKEYYRDSGKTRWHDKWFAAAQNNPRNGVPGLEGTYWSLYDGVLFVGVDTLAHEGREMDESVRRDATRLQMDWFDKVATSQRGRYQYIVVFQHYPYFKKSGPCDYGGYEKWSPLFDRHRVDFALSGDSHSYVRSQPVRDGKVSRDGTVYVVCPEIDGHMSEPDIAKGEDLVAAYDTHGSSYGACRFEVTPSSMKMHYFCKGTDDRDFVEVPAKRRQPQKRNVGR